MTRSGSGGEAKKEFKEKFSMWESQTSSGLGAWAVADMGEGRGSTGSPTARLVRQALDVGLDSLASLILLCLSIVRASSTLRSACAKLVLFFQDKRTEKTRKRKEVVQ